MTTPDKAAAEGVAGFVSDALDLVSDRMQELVMADMPSILQAVAQANDPQELKVGLEASLRQAALLVALSLQMQVSGTEKEAVEDMIHQLESAREGMK